jgi:murein DD-endopeptidase MepM/ murein hydrolase activator NlpD
MQQRSGKPGSNYSPLVRGLSWIGSIGMLSSGMVWAQSRSLPVAAVGRTAYQPPVSVEAVPEEVPAAPAPPPPPVASELRPEPPAPAPAPEWWVPPPVATEEVPTPENPAEPLAETSAPEELPQVGAEPAPNASAPIDYSNVYIDSTSLSTGAGRNYEPPNSVVLSERGGRKPQPTTSTLVPAPGETAAGLDLPSLQELPLAEPDSEPAYAQPYSEPAYAQPYAEPAYAQTYSEPAYAQTYSEPVAEIGSVNVGPLSVSSTGIRVATPPPPTPGYYYQNSREFAAIMPGNGNTSLLFPLSIPATITSVFGWRIHPISGLSSFHDGTDLGAPLGVPVLAAYDGKVAVADFLGGYGLTVVLEHNNGTQETLYGHLSELLVKPGDTVVQGAVIGRVGSTGNSTGPHLHFELRELTQNGWETIDPGEQLNSALASLTKMLQKTAQATQKPKV